MGPGTSAGTPLYGCLLIGGKSRRMGRAKHLLEQDGVSWVERSVAILEPHVEQVLISGKGTLPDTLAHLTRLSDVPGVAGPMAGILSALRWHPTASWLVLACDLPDVTSEALSWLLAQRRDEETWAVVPKLSPEGPLEPLLACYDARCRGHFEELARRQCFRLGALAGKYGVETPQPPEELRTSWLNVNTSAELARRNPLSGGGA